ncbi:retrovirus-related pol polyprotein from transposon TNT 1-94 [Tanacetum coccineum]
MSNTNTNFETQTSNALHNAIMEAIGKDRPPMLAPVYHPQNHPYHYTQNSSTKSQQAATRNRGKANVNSPLPTDDQEPKMVAEDDALSKEKEIDKLMALISLSFKKIYKPTNNNLRTSSNTSRANQDNSPRINRGNGYDNQRTVNVVGARENVGTQVVQQSGIQCYNCKEYRHVARECQKPKQPKDAAYHKENMLLCKQEEAGFQLNAEHADWRDDTDDEPDDQELEAHDIYMAQIQEVTPDVVDNSGPIYDTEPLQKEQNNDDNYNVFTNDREHLEQPESVDDTYLEEQGDTNITIDSLDMRTNREMVDQDDNDLAKERDLLASLIEKPKCKINDSKNYLKKFQDELKKRHDVNYMSKVELDCAKAKTELMSYKTESQKSINNYSYQINDLNQKISDMKKELVAHQETISIMSQQKEDQTKAYKTREEKELEKVIALENKIKVLDDIVYKTGQSVQTMNMLNRNCKMSFVKPDFLKKAQRANPRLYDIGCYNDNLALMLAPESDETIRLAQESRSKLSDLIRPFDYEKLNNLYDLFVPQREKSPEQRYFSERSKMSHTLAKNENSKESFNKHTTLLERRMDESIRWDQKEYYYADHMNAILGVYTTLDEFTDLQCDYVDQVGKYSLAKKDFSKSNSVTKNDVSEDFLKPVTAQILPQNVNYQLEDKVMPNNSQGKKQKVEYHRRNFKFSNNKTSVTACNDSLNAKTPNVNFVCVTCGKCVLNDNHDMCVLHYINGVNSRTKQPIVVPISTKEPKQPVNQSVVTPFRRIVATDSTVKKPKSIIRKLYKHVSKTCSWWYPKFTPSVYKWKPKCLIGNVNTNVTMPLGNASRTANILESMNPRFGNDQIAPILVAFWKSTRCIRDMKGNDLLTGSCGSDLYSITLQDTSTPNPICLMAKATSLQAWLWHRRLSHLNFDTINLLSKYDIVTGIPKLKFIKDHLCSSCELWKAKYDIQAAGSDTRPPMLDRTDYESWSQRIRLYCRGKENGLLILQSIDQGPFELGTTRNTLGTTP